MALLRLYKKDDAVLGIVLIFSAVLVFHRPFRFVIDAAREVETRYHLDLIPALLVLLAVSAFHEHRKRLKVRVEKAALVTEVGRARARSTELERCIQLAQALAYARDVAALERSLYRYLPTFVRTDAWLLTYRRDQWHLSFQKSDTRQARTVEVLEEIARKALAASAPSGQTLQVGGETCFTLVAGGSAVAVIGVRDFEHLTPLEQESLTMATALVAIAVRNVHLFQEISEEGITDSLTGCFNRRHALDRLTGEVRRAQRGGRPASILMLDLDRFRSINEEYGHLAGDRTLARVGQRLRSMLRSTDIPCRYGGDEFLVILPETPLVAARHVADCVRREIAALAASPDEVIESITVSVGLAASEAGDRDAETIIERADRDLYEAKRKDRARLAAGHAHVASAG